MLHVCLPAGYLVVDDKEYTGHSSGRHIGLDLTQNMFLGGVPDYQNISPYAAQTSGFTGRNLCFMCSKKRLLKVLTMDLSCTFLGALTTVCAREFRICRRRFI